MTSVQFDNLEVQFIFNAYKQILFTYDRENMNMNKPTLVNVNMTINHKKK